MSEHRDAAEQALVNAQRNPIMSAEQHFAVAQVHVLLAIEQRLRELIEQQRPRNACQSVPFPLLPSEAV